MTTDAGQAAQEEAELNAGFNGTELPTPTPEVQPEPEPEYAKITAEEYQRLSGIAAAFEESRAENKRQLDTAFGKIGGLQQALNALQSATPAGQAVTVSEDDFDELRAEFPELAKMQVAGLNKVLGKMRGTGEATPNVDEVVGSRVSAAAQEIERKFEMKLVAKEHKDWREVTASEGYRKWLETQPQEYRLKIYDSWDSDEVSESITNYKKSIVPPPAAPAPKPTTNRFRDAVQPKSDGGVADPSSEDDDFMAGFNSR